MEHSLQEQIAELERELQLRARVYPRWVASGKLASAASERQMDRLRAALQTLRDVKALGLDLKAKP